jgi:hypothetical protein
MKPNRVYGVDFSGGTDAGRKIWIAGGTVSDGILRLDICQRVATLPDSGWAREAALEALRHFIERQAPCVVGLDFPFGLPRRLMDADRWEVFAQDFRNSFADADALQKACTDKAMKLADQKELRRATDVMAKTPFSPYNRRLYRQTFYGIRDVLAPLMADGVACVLPMQPPCAGKAWLLEICPASTLKQMEEYRRYKGVKYTATRDEILTTIAQRLHVMVPESVRAEVLADREADALDSIIAAATAACALRESIACGDDGDASQVEGLVFL